MSGTKLDTVGIKSRVRARLLAGPKELERLSPPEQRLRVRAEVLSVLREERAILPASAVTEVVNQVSDEVVGLGPIERLLRDPEVSEVMVNGADDVYVERKGRIEKVEDLSFEGEEQVFHLIERIVAPLGLRVDESSPYVDARLPDGSRVNAIVPPLSLCGPVVTIRKFTLRPLTPQDLVQMRSASAEMIRFLGACVEARANIVVCGGTGSGKTTLLGALSSFVPTHERVVTIEDAAELRLSQPHVVSLEARPPNVEGVGEVSVRALVRNALRMRPDRIVVGEVRGGEALDMLQAMNTGHEGSLCTAHANSPRDLLSRLETMALMSDVDLPVSHVREQIAAAIDLIVHLVRLSEGRRVVERVTSVEGLRGAAVALQDVFRWHRGIRPEFERTGHLPRVLERLPERGGRPDLAALLLPAGGEVAGRASSSHPRAVTRSESPRPKPMIHARCPRAVHHTIPCTCISRPSRNGSSPAGWAGPLRTLGGVLE